MGVSLGMATSRPPTDLRKQRVDLNRKLLMAVIFVLVVVGGFLIAIFYSAPAAVMGATCLAAGAGLIGVLWLIFSLLGKWVGE
jgi:protein-S-isoprenylcysteine O-methyltransferase Ste14